MANLLSALNFKLGKNILKDYKLIVILELQGMHVNTEDLSRDYSCTLSDQLHWRSLFPHLGIPHCGILSCHSPRVTHRAKDAVTERCCKFSNVCPALVVRGSNKDGEGPWKETI